MVAAHTFQSPGGEELTFTRREDLGTVAYWLTLGAAAGGLGGLLVGGIGGRLAMFLLRLTSDESVRGIDSDDGFTIGRFDLVDTIGLLAVTTVMGTVVGLICVFGRPFFPRRGMPMAWAFAGAITGGAILIHKDGIDFVVLEPNWLAVALFMAIPAAGAGLIAWFIEVFPRFWWDSRMATAAAALVLLPSLIFFPLAIAALIVGSCWWLVMQVPALRTLPNWKPARFAAIAVFGLIIVMGALNLSDDLQGIL